MTSHRAASLLIIADRLELVQAVRFTVQDISEVSSRGFLWEQSSIYLTPDVVQNSDLVIAELFRTYPMGKRAEAIVLAERWASVTPVLIVAPRYFSQRFDCPGYWDFSADDTLAERTQYLLETPEATVRNFDQLRQHFRSSLSLPRQH